MGRFEAGHNHSHDTGLRSFSFGKRRSVPEDEDMAAGEELRRYLNYHPPSEVAEQIRSGFVSSELEETLQPLLPLVKAKQPLCLNDNVATAVYHYFSQKKKAP